MHTRMWDTSYKMLHNLKRRMWVHKTQQQFGSTAVQADETSLAELRDVLEHLTLEVLAKADVCASCVLVTIEHVGTTEHRQPVLRSMVSFAEWDTRSAMRLFLGLAHIERAMRRAVASSWFSHAAHFGGVWLHACDAILQGPGIKQLASALNSLEKGGVQASSRMPGTGT